jgi:Uncharacterized protein involved in propionate catabolism
MVASPALTKIFARYAARSSFEDLPQTVRHEAARALLNWFGVAIAGSTAPAVTVASELVRSQGGARLSTVLGQNLMTDPASAAFVNCIASSVHAYDDAHLATVAHPSGPAVAAVVAIAEAQRFSGKEFLNAIALGIEVQCRIASMLVLPPSKFDTGIYVNGFSAPIGVAAAVGRLSGLDEQQMNWALGIAASQASGFRATHGTMTAHFRPGHATRAGVQSALLAKHGFDCTENSLEAPGGLVEIFAPDANRTIAVDGLGARHEMLTNRYKPYPCGIVIHPIIDACLGIRSELPVGCEILTVELLVNPLVTRLTGKRSPRTSLESHVSVYHWAATALLHGVAGLEQTEEAWLFADDIVAMRDLIVAQPSAEIGKGEAVVSVTLADGSSFTKHVTSARGSSDRPMDDAELMAKFEELASQKMTVARAQDLGNACLRIGDAADAGDALRPYMS